MPVIAMSVAVEAISVFHPLKTPIPPAADAHEVQSDQSMRRFDAAPVTACLTTVRPIPSANTPDALRTRIASREPVGIGPSAGRSKIFHGPPCHAFAVKNQIA